MAEFGDVNVVRANLRDIDHRVARRRNRMEFVDGLRQDVVYAARSLRRTPVVALTIILTLALGLGVNAAMFSLLDVIFQIHPNADVNIVMLVDPTFDNVRWGHTEAHSEPRWILIDP